MRWSLRWVAGAVAAFAALLVASWIAGRCSGRESRLPPVVEGRVDPGAPVAGPVAEAPTVTECLPVARPDLTRAELEAAAARVGLRLAAVDARQGAAGGRRAAPEGSGVATAAPGADRAADGVLRGSGAGPAEDAVGGVLRPDPGSAAPDIAPGPDRAVGADSGGPGAVPALLAEERFGPGPAGDVLTAQAWLLKAGARVDLRGAWEPYQPPAPPVCPSGGFFGNEARWSGQIGGGVVGMGPDAGAGAWGSLGWRGFRAGVTMGADAGVAWSSALDEPVYHGGLTINW